MSYTHLIPSMDEYANRFKQLGESDIKIIKGLVKYGFSNVNKLAKDISIPQQTVSYHCRKLDKQNLVRFRALLLPVFSLPVHASEAIDRAALLHDSRSDLYRTPGGSIPIQGAVTLRFRTAAGGVESITVWVWDTLHQKQLMLPMAVFDYTDFYASKHHATCLRKIAPFLLRCGNERAYFLRT